MIRDRFQKSRPNSMCDKTDMVPADGNNIGAAPGADNASTPAAAAAAAANGAEGESGGKG